MGLIYLAVSLWQRTIPGVFWLQGQSAKPILRRHKQDFYLVVTVWKQNLLDILRIIIQKRFKS